MTIERDHPNIEEQLGPNTEEQIGRQHTKRSKKSVIDVVADYVGPFIGLLLAGGPLDQKLEKKIETLIKSKTEAKK